MSGRKRSEVQHVLKNADQTRKGIFDKKFQDIQRTMERFNSIEKEVSNSKVDLKDEKKSVESIKNSIISIDKEIVQLGKTIQQKAKRFKSYMEENFDDEYAKAGVLLQTYRQKSKELSSIENNITKKIDKLLQVKELQEQVKEKESLINNKIQNITYEDPLDVETRLDFTQLCGMFLEDMREYDEIVSLQKDIANLIDKQEYQQALKQIDALHQKVEKIEQEIEQNIIKTKENLQTAFAIENVLEESGYEFESEIIDGKISNGIKIKTINNDDFELNLTNIVVHDEEKIDVDFIVNDTNTGCKIKASELQSKLNAQGIPFNITDWGTASGDTKSAVSKGNKNVIQEGGNHES